MNFHESGLPNNQLLEDAFNYSYANILSYRPDAMADFIRQMNAQFDMQINMLNLDKADGKVPEDQFNFEKETLEKMRDEQIKMGPRIVDNELHNMFLQRRLSPAQELLKSSAENISPELLAATLLVETVRSAVDYLKVEEKFGGNVAHLVAEMNHIDCYPSTRSVSLEKAEDDIKRVYMAQIISNLDFIVAQAEFTAKNNPSLKMMFIAGQEDMVFSDAKALWGNDQKLDQRFIETFNSAAEALSSQFRIEVSATNTLELVKSNITPPITPPLVKPKKPTGLGDKDIF